MEETIFTLWIGTNDVGAGALITGSSPGATVVNTTTCAVNWVKTLYESGAKNFLYAQMIPLQHTVLYSADSYPNRFWTLERNTTEWSVLMTEMVNTGNALSRALLELLAPTLPGAHVGTCTFSTQPSCIVIPNCANQDYLTHTSSSPTCSTTRLNS